MANKGKVRDEFTKIITIIRTALKYVGIRLLGRPSKDIKELILSNIFCYVNIVWLASVFLQFLYFIRLNIVKRNFYDILFIWPCGSYAILALSKTFGIVYNKIHIEKLLLELEAYNMEEKDEETQKAYEESQAQGFKYLRMVMSITIVSNFFMALMFCLTPYILMIDSYIRTKQFEVTIMFPVEYGPIDPLASYTGFIVVYIHQAVSAIYAVAGTAAADMLLFFLCTCINMEFQLLGFKSEKVIRDCVKSRTPNLDNDILDTTEESDEEIDTILLKEKIKAIILRHLELLEKVDLVDKTHAKQTLLNFVVSSILICATAFNTVNLGDWNVFKFALMLICALWQLLHFCYYGDLIMRSNSVLADSIVKCNWYLGSKDFKNIMIIILTRTEKPCKITAYKFVDVNLQSYRKILATSWSYFALLNTVYHSNK